MHMTHEVLGSNNGNERYSNYIDEWFSQLDPEAKDVHKIIVSFGKELANRISPNITPKLYYLAIILLGYDCTKGVNGFTGEPLPSDLANQHISLVNIFSATYAKDLARGAFGDDFANEYVEIVTATNIALRKTPDLDAT